MGGYLDIVTSFRSHLLVLLRFVGFLLVLSAEFSVIGELSPRFNAATHFGYFTVLSNIFAALVLAAGVLVPVPGTVRGASVLYMVTTGIVYAGLLSGIDTQTPPYANWVFHVAVPFLVAVDWLLDPPREHISVRQALRWLAFPAAYLVITLVRGPIIHWYPYPFLDPGEEGYGTVAIMSALIATALCLLTLLIVKVGNSMGGSERPATRAPRR
ncbi:hypothetical protein SAMN05421630_10719 [Prauserella marina]|uniref:Uncharacterized protein n=1 Tax=Prauserella marina TaxID=530584 RepID=A0A1G6TA78_9PSEU|nr:hypothetical protein DES30_106422 [Prauserella marina]SDD25754.1 hypothetical protein SAMN05421630_10719 [Prauserella marina]